MRGESTLSGNIGEFSSFVAQAEEICRVGFLRTLCWCLFHRLHRIRLLAAQVCKLSVFVSSVFTATNFDVFFVNLSIDSSNSGCAVS